MKSPIVLFSRTAEKEEDSEKKAEQNVETKLDSGKQKKKENAVERSGENIRTDSAEEAPVSYTHLQDFRLRRYARSTKAVRTF